jgi:hypothetical protein
MDLDRARPGCPSKTRIELCASLPQRLRPQGYLVIGSHERLPGDVPELVPLTATWHIFQKRALPLGPGNSPVAT